MWNGIFLACTAARSHAPKNAYTFAVHTAGGKSNVEEEKRILRQSAEEGGGYGFD